MANFVAPVYTPTKAVQRMIEFRGLNRLNAVDEGEMSEMHNLTSEQYPLIAPRKPRGHYSLPEHITVPLQLIPKLDRIAMIAKTDSDTVAFCYDGNIISSVTGLNETSFMVSINTKICFFPQKTYIQIIRDGASYTIGDFGSLESEVDDLLALDVTITNENASITLSSGHGFKYDDAINIVGALSYSSGGSTQSIDCNVSCIIEQVVNANTLILPRETFIELTGTGATDIKFTGSISRTMPSLDYVIEWNNRLWGVSNADNTVYACKLGDPTNWQYFQGTSLDSYYAQQGSDGDWTGCAPYSGHLIFFKPNLMTKIYGTAPSNYQVVNTRCFGVEKGSSKSVAVLNDTVLYKASIGVMAYDGGIPYLVSEKLGSKYIDAVAGTEGRKYYISMHKESEAFELLVLDPYKGLWHREDITRFRDTCLVGDQLYYSEYLGDPLICSDTLICNEFLLLPSGSANGSVNIINPIHAEETYGDIEWKAVFGPINEYVENRKVYSNMSIRLLALEDSTVRVYMKQDDKDWELVKAFNLAKTNGERIPVIPRRCDRFSIKIEGQGNCQILSLTRRYRMGSEGRL